MSDILKGVFTGMEEFARTMREHTVVGENISSSQKELIQRVNHLADRLEKLLGILEEKLGPAIEITPAKHRRMMDIKRRIVDNVHQHPDGIRPPQLARILGTKVQNLYPHLKAAVVNDILVKDESGAYFPPSGDGNHRKEKVGTRGQESLASKTRQAVR